MNNGGKMLSKIFHWIIGYARFEAEGQVSRFLNMAVKSGLTMWNLQKKDSKAVGYIRANEYKKLRTIQKRCRNKMKCTKKRGLPFYTYRLSRRKGLLIGAVAAIWLYVFLYSFIWSVDINGIEKLTKSEVEDVAKVCGVYVGAKKKEVDPAEAATRIRARIPGISWISVNTNKATVEIEIKEVEEKPDMPDNENPSNILAEREGVIVYINPESGKKLVNIGDVVLEGQTLITGVYAEEPLPYINKHAAFKSYAVRARGSVIAETVRTYEINIPRTQESEEVVGDKTNSYLMIFGIKIPLGFHMSYSDEIQHYEEENILELLDKKMPVSIKKDKYIFTEKHYTVLNDEELKEIAKRTLREKQKEDIGYDNSAKILEENIEYKFTEDGCVLYATCRFEEEIGKEEELLWNITDSNDVFYK